MCAASPPNNDKLGAYGTKPGQLTENYCVHPSSFKKQVNLPPHLLSEQISRDSEINFVETDLVKIKYLCSYKL
jgi:hypothetical protein